METASERKRNGDDCEFLCKKRFKNSTYDQDSESRSLESSSVTTSSSPRDSGFRETVIRSSSGDDSTSIERDAAKKTHKKLSSRVRILEQKVNWIGSELCLIRQMLEFITKVLPNDSTARISLDNTQEKISKDHSDTSKSCYLNNSQNINKPFFVHDCKVSTEDENLSCQPTEKTDQSERDFSSSSTQNHSARESKNDDDGYSREEKSNNKNEACANPTAHQVKTNVITSSKHHGNKVADLYRILPETLSAIDIIHLWELGTADIIPIKLWSKEELARGGERLAMWQQIITLFEGECNRNLRTFVYKYSTANGDVMSVPEIIARSQLGRKSSSNSVSADYQRAKEITLSNSEQNRTEENRAEQKSNENSSENRTPKQDDRFRMYEPAPYLYILPRKLNGSKISAKDVINIWEKGHGRIPPVKSWTPNQKLRQQSKISRWKKIVDIFTNECTGDIKVFEALYSNDCGTLLPIAAIINKYEQNHSTQNGIHQPTMSKFSNNFLGECQTPNNWQSFKPNSNLEDVPDTKRRHYSEKTISQQNKVLFKGSIWKEQMNSYDKEEFCREYINSRMSETTVMYPKPDNIDKEKSDYNERDDSTETGASRKMYTDLCVEKPSDSNNKKPMQSRTQTARLTDNLALNGCLKMSGQSSISAMPPPFLAKAVDKENSVAQNGSASVPPSSSCADEIKTIKPITKHPAYMERSVEETLFVYQDNDNAMYLPDTSDPFEIISLWENGSSMCPPFRLMKRDVIDSNPKLSLWRKFMDIFYYECNADKRVALQKFSDGDDHLLPVHLILKNFYCEKEEQKQQQMQARAATYESKVFDYQSTNKIKESKSDIIFTLPRKINGRKVSAKDVINIWNRGYKEIPPVGSWLPQQKVRQQSKISRWKKIVEIFENDCGSDMQVFEAKCSNNASELLPIATIISNYEKEKDNNVTYSFNPY